MTAQASTRPRRTSIRVSDSSSRLRRMPIAQWRPALNFPVPPVIAFFQTSLRRRSAILPRSDPMGCQPSLEIKAPPKKARRSLKPYNNHSPVCPSMPTLLLCVRLRAWKAGSIWVAGAIELLRLLLVGSPQPTVRGNPRLPRSDPQIPFTNLWVASCDIAWA